MANGADCTDRGCSRSRRGGARIALARQLGEMAGWVHGGESDWIDFSLSCFGSYRGSFLCRVR